MYGCGKSVIAESECSHIVGYRGASTDQLGFYRLVKCLDAAWLMDLWKFVSYLDCVVACELFVIEEFA